ncbi:MAG TPA: DUF3267 domain-containing protein [Thermaerobacter sp.]
MGPREAATARVYWAMAVGMAAALAWFALAAEVGQPGAGVQCSPPSWPWPFAWWWGAAVVGVGFVFGALEAQRLCPDGAAPSSSRGVLLASAAASTIMMFVAVRAVGLGYRALYGAPLEGGPSSMVGVLWLALPLVATVLLHEACHLAVFRLFGVPSRLRVVLWPRLVVATEFDGRETPFGVLAVSLMAPVVVLTILGFALIAEPAIAPWAAWAVAANWAGSTPDLGRLAMLVADLPLHKGVGRGGAPATS